MIWRELLSLISRQSSTPPIGEQASWFGAKKEQVPPMIIAPHRSKFFTSLPPERAFFPLSLSLYTPFYSRVPSTHNTYTIFSCCTFYHLQDCALNHAPIYLSSSEVRTQLLLRGDSFSSQDGRSFLSITTQTRFWAANEDETSWTILKGREKKEDER